MARINMQAAGFTPEMLGRPPQEQAPRPALSQGGALSRGAPMARPTRMQSQPGAAQGIPAEYYMPAAYSAPPNYPISAKRAMWSDLLYDVGAIMQGQAPTSPHRTRMEREHLMAQERMQQMRTAAANRYKYQNVGDRLYRIDQFTGQADPVTEAQKDYGFQESGDVLYRTDKTTGEAVAVTDAPEPGGMFEGTGMQAQMFNALTNPDPNVRGLSFAELTKPKTVTTPEGTYTIPGTDPAALNAIIAGAGYEPIGAAGAAEPAESAGGSGGSGGSGQAASAGVVPTGFTAKPTSAADAKSLNFGLDMAGAMSDIQDIEAQFPDFDPTNVFTALMAGDGPMATIGRYAGNEAEQRFASAILQFVSAERGLRSGSEVPKSEIERARKIYFPEPGEEPGQVEQKRRARARALRNILTASENAMASTNPLGQVYVTDNGEIILRSDFEATAREEGITPEQALEQALEAGTIRSMTGTDMAINVITGKPIGQKTEAPREAPREPVGIPQSVLSGWSQGSTALFGDELYGALAGGEGIPGGIGSLVSMAAGGAERENLGLPPASYEQRRDTARELNANAQDDNFWSYTAGELLGALSMPSAIALAPKVMSPLARFFTGAAAGGAEGALAGYGGSKGGPGTPGEVGLAGGIGATMGPLGQMAPAAIAGGKRLFDIAGSTPMQNAERIVGRELVQGGNMTTGQQVAAQLAGLGDRGMLADLVPEAAGTAARRVGGGELLEAAQRRQETAPTRIMEILEEMLGQNSATYGGRVSDLQSRAGELGQRYDELRDLPLPREAFAELLDVDSSMVQSAIKNARDEMIENGYRKFDLEADEIPFGFIDALKKEFDAVAEQAGGVGSGRSGQEGARAAQIARRIREAADSVVSEYKPLREQYQGVIQSLDALGVSPPGRPLPQLSGRRLLDTGDPRRIDDMMDFAGSLSPEGMQDFRLGVAESASDFVRRNATETGNLAGRLRPGVEGGARADALLRSAQDPAAGRAALDALEGESTMNATLGQVSPKVGSVTSGNQAAAARLGTTTADIVRDTLVPDGLTAETAMAMRELLIRGDLSVDELERIVQQGIRSGALEASQESARKWMDGLVRGYRAGYGALQEQ